MKPLIPIVVTTGITLASLPLRASTPIHPLQPSAPRTVTVSESQTPPVILFAFNRAGPIGCLDVDRLHAQTMPTRIFNQYRRAVEAHRLVVQQGAGESGKVFNLDVG